MHKPAAIDVDHGQARRDDPNARRRQFLLEGVEALHEMLRMEDDWRHTTDPCVEHSIGTVLAALGYQIKTAEAQIRSLIDQAPTIAREARYFNDFPAFDRRYETIPPASNLERFDTATQAAALARLLSPARH